MLSFLVCSFVLPVLTVTVEMLNNLTSNTTLIFGKWIKKITCIKLYEIRDLSASQNFSFCRIYLDSGNQLFTVIWRWSPNFLWNETWYFRGSEYVGVCLVRYNAMQICRQILTYRPTSAWGWRQYFPPKHFYVYKSTLHCNPEDKYWFPPKCWHSSHLQVCTEALTRGPRSRFLKPPSYSLVPCSLLCSSSAKLVSVGHIHEGCTM